MILVLFHALYLLGSYVLRRYVGMPADVEEPPQDSMSKEMKERVNLKRRFSNDADDEANSNITFNPPAYLQRYKAVKDVLANYNGKLKKIVDFGCSELSFYIYLKNLPGVNELLFVDIDEETLNNCKDKLKPLHVDYLHRRSTPLVMKVIEGSINQHDKMVADCDAVVCIELIEHLYPEDLNNFPYSVFGFIRPKVAVVTTPNADFNVLFKGMTGFRHWDHKFEWTRSQFEDWANNVILRFPEYEVTFDGIANGPEGSENLGSCSQMAIFNKKYDSSVPKIEGIEGLYKTIKVFDYPFEIDNRSDEQKILDDAVYYIRKLSFNDDELEEEIPLSKLRHIMRNVVSVVELREILQNNGWNCEERGEAGPVVLIPPPSSISDNSFAVENFLDDFDDDGSEPGAPSNYFVQGDIEFDHENSEDWDSEPHIIVPNEEHEPRDLEHDNSNEELENGSNFSINPDNVNLDDLDWENEQDREDENYGLNAENFNEESEDSSNSSINPDDVNLDDLETESRSSELDNSPIDGSILISSFSETKGSENSCSQVQASSINNDDNAANLNDSGSSQVQQKNSETGEASGLSKAKQSTSTEVTTRLVENSIFNKRSHFEDSSDIEFTNSEQVQCQNVFKLNTSISSKTNDTFSNPKYTSSPHALSTLCKKRKIGDTEILHSSNSSTNEISKSILENNCQLNDLNSCSNTQDDLEDEVSDCMIQINESKSAENKIKCTGTIPKTNRKILDLKVDAQIITKIEKLTPNTPESLINSSSPEIMDSGYPNSSSPPDLSPEHDFSSITQDHDSNSESPSIDDAPRIGFFEAELENRDLANNNLDGEGNNLEAEVNERANDLRPFINVLENDLQNENDIYDVRNGFPDWLLRIH